MMLVEFDPKQVTPADSTGEGQQIPQDFLEKVQEMGIDPQAMEAALNADPGAMELVQKQQTA